MEHRIVYAELNVNGAVVVTLNGTTIYHEDNDRGNYQCLTALDVANNLASALGVSVAAVMVDVQSLPSPEEWNFDDIADYLNGFPTPAV